jgi:hypothetical protein
LPDLILATDLNLLGEQQLLLADGFLKECQAGRITPEPRPHVCGYAADADALIGDPIDAGAQL